MGVHFIEFPKLGIRLEVGPIAFEIPEFLGIGPIRVHWYGIIIATAILIGLLLATKQAERFNIREDDLLDMFLIALPVSVIFSRLFFMIFKWDMFKNDLKRVFYIWEGGVTIYGAVIGAVLAVFIFSRIRKIDMWALADFACVYLPLGQAIGRWGNFFNQELYGKNTDLPWGMTGSIIQSYPDPGIDPGVPVHPTFLYESIWNLIVFFVLLSIRKRNKVRGSVFASYLLLYSFARFMLEFLRVDDFQSGNNVRYNQVVAAVIFAGALIFLITSAVRQKKARTAPVYDTPSAYAEILKTLKDEEQAESYSNDNASDLTDNENVSAEETGADSPGTGPEGTGENSPAADGNPGNDGDHTGSGN